MQTFADEELEHLHAVARRAALRSGLGREHSEDVAQRTMLLLLESPRPITARSSWVYTVARRASYRTIFREKRSIPVEFIEEFGTTSSLEKQFEVRRQVSRLPDESRTVLLERFVEERSNAEVARDLGVSPSTVKRRLALSGRRLRAVL